MKKGIIAGNFDVIHPGYLKMFKEIKDNCEDVYILLHDDPTIERPEKKKPVLSVQERRDILENFFECPIILSYNTEAELLFLIKSIDPDVRFLGDDYIDKRFTGDDLGIHIHWISRSHGWSTTKFKKLIGETLK
jgi:glycerol-3-phosphate cytidylyltransferase